MRYCGTALQMKIQEKEDTLFFVVMLICYGHINHIVLLCKVIIFLWKELYIFVIIKQHA